MKLRCHRELNSYAVDVSRAQDLFNIVAVDDFNMGAMENKSLNIFNSRLVLADPDSSTDGDYARIEGVVGHEYFHNWTGARLGQVQPVLFSVTCQQRVQLRWPQASSMVTGPTSLGLSSSFSAVSAAAASSLRCWCSMNWYAA
jgi:hypothetical protein